MVYCTVEAQNKSAKCLLPISLINGLFGSLERKESRGEESSGEESRGDPPCLDVFKISKGKWSN